MKKVKIFLMKIAHFVIFLFAFILGIINAIPDAIKLSIGIIIGLSMSAAIYMHQEYFDKNDDDFPQHPVPSE